MINTTTPPATAVFINQQFSSQHQHTTDKAETESKDSAASDKDNDQIQGSQKSPYSSQQLTPQELKKIEQLKTRDTEVRAHERAHLNAAGTVAISGANFTFVTGSDGKRYAVGGEVSIDISAVADDPSATLKKADIIRRAALAPITPSAKDRQIAARAVTMASDARIEIQQLQLEEKKTSATDKESDETSEDQQKPTEEVVDTFA